MKWFKSLEYCRGLSALVIVMYHGSEVLNYYDVVEPLLSIARYGDAAVQVFFVISGYVIFQSAEKYFGNESLSSYIFIKRRLLRIYPPFIASLILSLIVAYITKGETYTVLNILSVGTLTYLPLGYTSPNAVYWYLVHLQQFVFAISIINLPFFSKKKTLIILASSIIAAVKVTGVISNKYINFPLLYGQWYFFLLGIMVFLIIQEKEKRWATVPVYVLLVSVGLSTIDYHKQVGAIFSLILFFLFYLDAYISSAKNFLIPIAFLGKISYSLYLIHVPIYQIINVIKGGVFHSAVLYYSGITISIMSSIFFYKLLERPFLSPSLAIDRNAEKTCSIRSGA